MRNVSINMENYEIYLMDYFDNQLSENEVDALLHFLELHPKIKEEAEGIGEINLTPEKIGFDGRTLKKDSEIKPQNEINAQNSEEFFVASLENDLTPEQKEELRVFLDSNAALQKEFDLTQKMVVTANESIRFKQKEQLYLLATDHNEKIDDNNFEEYCVAFNEGDLDDPQTQLLNDYISDNNELISIFNSYKSLNLMADKSVVFANKNSLKKRAAMLNFSHFSYSNVAAVAAIFLLLFLFPTLLDNSKRNLSLNHNARINIEPIVSNSHLPVQETIIPIKTEVKANFPKEKSIQRKEIVIAKAAIIQPIFMNAKVDMDLSDIQPISYTMASQTDGYYEVTLEETTFISRNPSLAKRVVKGVRNLLNISAQEIKTPADRLTLWDVADAGLKGFGALTENEIVLSRK